MKTNKLQLSSGIVRTFPFLLLMALVVRCTGPEGPMGPKGEDGLDGLNGVDGINYTHSVIYDVDASEWVGDVNGYDAWLDVPEITEDIYYEGAVLVYRLVENLDPKSFNLLPYTYVDNALTVYMDFDAYVGGIDLIYKEVYEGVNDTPAITGLMSFKIVIIEGVPLAQLKTMVDVRNLAAVLNMFNVDNGQKRIE
jgi:hypothetical protein